jgi:membrane protease YdiL (CAAX protease family)
LFFSFVHASYYGFLARAGLGMILGYMFYYSKSLWLPIIAHFINNAFAVTMMYYMNKQGTLTTKALDERFPIWYGVIALGLIVALMIVFRNESKKLGTYYLDNTETKSSNPFENDFDFDKRSNTGHS